MQKTLLEIGTIKDILGRTWDAFAVVTTQGGYSRFSDMVFELHEKNGELLETLTASSLSEVPTIFMQRDVNALESDYQDKQSEEHAEYLKDLRNERGV